MRWKIILVSIIFVVLAAFGGMGWLKWQATQKQKAIIEDLNRCRGWITSNQHERAQQELERILAENPNLAESDAVWATLADSYEQTSGKANDALRCWAKIHADYPTSPHFEKALASLASHHYNDGAEGGDPAQAEQLWSLIVTNYPKSEYVDDAELGLALIRFSDEPVALRNALWDLLEKNPDARVQTDTEDRLGELNMDLLLQRGLVEGEEETIYRVASGNTLEGIGRKFKVSPDLLMKINGIRNARALSIGKRVKIPNTDFSIVVNKTNNTLTLLNRGKFFKRYNARTGKENWLTATGKYYIENKVKDPTWKEPGGRVYPPGDPDNALGSRWLPYDSASGLGIHGTNDAGSVGNYASRGCVGLLNEDVEELFDLVRRGTPIEIIGEMKKK